MWPGKLLLDNTWFAYSSMAVTDTGSSFDTMLLVVQSTKQAGKRKASALNGLLPSHWGAPSHPGAAASVSQHDEQPEATTERSSANSGEDSCSCQIWHCHQNQCMLLLPIDNLLALMGSASHPEVQRQAAVSSHFTK